MSEEKAPDYPRAPGYPTQPGYPVQQQPDPSQQGVYPPPPQGPGFPPEQAAPGMQPLPPAYAAYPPPQPGQQPQQPQTVVVSTVHTTVINQLREHPANVQCPNCHNNVTTNVMYENGLLVILAILVIAFVFQLWLGCCLIPLCIDGLKDVHHTCPVCSHHLGVYKRL